MPMAAMDKTIIPTVEPTNILMMPPTSKTITPTNSHWFMPERSRLMTVASEAITKNTPAVPPKAVMIRSGPFLNPSTDSMRREIIRPMKKVKASNTGTPAAEFFVF